MSLAPKASSMASRRLDCSIWAPCSNHGKRCSAAFSNRSGLSAAAVSGHGLFGWGRDLCSGIMKSPGKTRFRLPAGTLSHTREGLPFPGPPSSFSAQTSWFMRDPPVRHATSKVAHRGRAGLYLIYAGAKFRGGFWEFRRALAGRSRQVFGRTRISLCADGTVCATVR